MHSLMSAHYPLENLKTLLIPRAEWRPYPILTEREAWESLPEPVRRAYIAEGVSVLFGEWPQTLSVRYMDFARDGNRSRYEHNYFERRRRVAALAIAECMENQGRFLDELVNGVWLISEESSWCVPAHIGWQRAGRGLPDTTEPVVDLFAAETAALLAWVDYLLGDALDNVSPLVRPRLYREVDARVLAPCLTRDDFGWMGFDGQRVNNWNPWIISNWLASALLLEPDADGSPEFTAGRRAASVAKAMASLDHFIVPYPADGGCDEGPGYWGRAGASLLDCLELLYSASDGRISVYDEPVIQDIGRFIYRVHIADDYFVNFADASAIVAPPPIVAFRYGQRIGDPALMALGAWAARKQDVDCEREGEARIERITSLGRLLPTLFSLEELRAVQPTPPLPHDVWLDQIQVMAARDQAGSSAGFYVAAKGGHNAESHNHNDVGNVIVYVDGKPVLIDVGVETYTRKTFSPQRYEIWTMQSAYHTLPTFDGVMQAPGETFAARDASYAADNAMARFTLDIAGAYPPEAHLAAWQRTVTLLRGVGVDITDAYTLTAQVGEITLSLMTPCLVDASAPGRIALAEVPLPDGRATGAAHLTYDAAKLTVAVEEIGIEDARLGPVWGNRLTRILFRATNPPMQDEWTLKIRGL